MSKFTAKPYIETVLAELSGENKAKLLNLINGKNAAGTADISYTVCDSASAMAALDAGVHAVDFRFSKTILWKGYFIKTTSYKAFVTFKTGIDLWLASVYKNDGSSLIPMEKVTADNIRALLREDSYIDASELANVPGFDGEIRLKNIDGDYYIPQGTGNDSFGIFKVTGDKSGILIGKQLGPMNWRLYSTYNGGGMEVYQATGNTENADVKLTRIPIYDLVGSLQVTSQGSYPNYTYTLSLDTTKGYYGMYELAQYGTILGYAILSSVYMYGSNKYKHSGIAIFGGEVIRLEFDNAGVATLTSAKKAYPRIYRHSISNTNLSIVLYSDCPEQFRYGSVFGSPGLVNKSNDGLHSMSDISKLLLLQSCGTYNQSGQLTAILPSAVMNGNVISIKTSDGYLDVSSVASDGHNDTVTEI